MCAANSLFTAYRLWPVTTTLKRDRNPFFCADVVGKKLMSVTRGIFGVLRETLVKRRDGQIRTDPGVGDA